MQNALSESTWDIVLCDYTLPQFSAMEALRTLQESKLDLPFIVISGTIGEESAVGTLKAGAHDFMVKGRLARLIPAIERELRDAEVRRLQRESDGERKELIARLEEINAEIERFTYTAFHDLRAPLVTIKGFLGTLKNNLDAGREAEARTDIRRIESAANKLDQILTNLLEIAKIGRVIRPPQEVDMGQVAQEVIQMLATQIHTADITFIVSPDLPRVYGDRTRLREVLENLIENAVKFTAGQSDSQIEIGIRDPNGERILFVKDNGRGIDPRYHNRIFNLFEKLDPGTEGTGIGLALVKRIVEIHGGRIWVESEGEGHGSTFCFTLADPQETKHSLSK